MMKTSELRIGNWVDQPNEGVTKVTSILNDLQIKTETGYVDKYCRSIPLTEEWLVRFGFEKPAHSWCGDKFHLSNWDKYPDCWCVALNKNNAILVDKLKHVHQLQNLYFALTGEELELT